MSEAVPGLRRRRCRDCVGAGAAAVLEAVPGQSLRRCRDCVGGGAGTVSEEAAGLAIIMQHSVRVVL